MGIKNKNMQILVNETAYAVEADASVESLKLMIENKEFVPSNLIRLVNGDADELEGGTLAANGVEEDDSLTMALDVNGGMRKKWRKSACVVSDVSAVRCVNAHAKFCS